MLFFEDMKKQIYTFKASDRDHVQSDLYEYEKCFIRLKPRWVRRLTFVKILSTSYKPPT